MNVHYQPPISKGEAYDRVIRNILNRYILEDKSHLRRTRTYRVPRFLLNDIARYWRTMAVDFAYKRRMRFGKGTAIRNLKLRLSRKLIYVAGLLTCFSCDLDICAPGCNKDLEPPLCIEHLQACCSQNPLEILAMVLCQYSELNQIALKLFNAYDSFIAILADKEKREHLEDLSEEKWDEDKLFIEARQLSRQFRDGLRELFFRNGSKLSELTQTYGVF